MNTHTWTEEFTGVVIIRKRHALIPCATKGEVALVGRGHEMGNITLTDTELDALVRRPDSRFNRWGTHLLVGTAWYSIAERRKMEKEKYTCVKCGATKPH